MRTVHADFFTDIASCSSQNNMLLLLLLLLQQLLLWLQQLLQQKLLLLQMQTKLRTSFFTDTASCIR